MPAAPPKRTRARQVSRRTSASTGSRSSPDAPPGADGNPNTTPPWVDTNVDVFDQVWAQEIDTLGFRPPKSDGQSDNHGPNNKLDVYLANLGNQGLYGYCTSDDPNLDRPNYRFWNFSAFCVIDEDFAEFPLPGLPSLRVTAAHEFFHASQFAYDIGEDLWLMEGTAVWMEDEVFDGVNDHLQYLGTSQLRRPWIPVDLGASGYRYGAWIFWRFLSERFDTGIVKRVWSLADGAQGARNRHSLRATMSAIKSRGSTFRRAFAEFGAWNVRPSARYDEGGSVRAPSRRAGRIRSRGRTAASGGRTSCSTTSVTARWSSGLAPGCTAAPGSASGSTVRRSGRGPRPRS